MRPQRIAAALIAAALLMLTPAWTAGDGTAPAPSSSKRTAPTATSTASAPTRPASPDQAVILADGTAAAPASAPETVKAVIAAANEIVGKPYRYGGGHRPFADGVDSGYDGSGAVSWALHAGGFLPAPLSAEQLREFGKPGPGRWITVLLCGDGAHMIIAGVRFDAHAVNDEQPSGPRWRARSRGQSGCVVRHPQDH